MDIPVDQVLIEASFRELGWLRSMQSADDFRSFTSPESVALIGESLPQVLRKVHSSLMIESTPGLFIELWTQEMKLRALLFGFFTSGVEDVMHRTNIIVC